METEQAVDVPSTSLFMQGVIVDSPATAAKMYRQRKLTATGEVNVLQVTGMAIFRTGSFRDSAGQLSEWTKEDLEAMVDNFKKLKASNQFPDVPVRAGHQRAYADNLATVVGYHQDIYTEDRVNPASGRMETYLLADYEIIDPSKFEAIESGLWRNRSAEIGPFLTNDEEAHYPVYLGFGYVDVPAVEGLNFSKESRISFLMENPEPSPEVEMEKESLEAAVSEFSAAPATFTLFGRSVTSADEVQKHIDLLESFQKETLEASRVAFVEKLASEGKIPAPAVDAQVAFAKTLSDEQFAMWSASFADASALPLFEKHDVESTSKFSADAGAVDPNAAEIDDLRQIISMHQRSGMPSEKIEKLPSFARLMQLTQEKD